MAIRISNTTFHGVGTAVIADNSDVRIEGSRLEGTGRVAQVTGGSLSVSNNSLSNPRKMDGAASMGAPARCFACGHSYLSSRYTLMNARFYAESHVQDACPKCHSSDAYLAIGVLDFARDMVEFVQGPDVSRDLLERLLKEARDALKSGGDMPDPREAVLKKPPAQREPWTREQKQTAWSQVIALAIAALNSYDTGGLVRSASDLIADTLHSAYEHVTNQERRLNEESTEPPAQPRDADLDGPIEL